MNTNIWMPRDPDIGYDASSRAKPKRAHQLFMDTSEPELLLSNKKQAIEAVNNRNVSGIPNANFSIWENTSNFQPVSPQFNDCPFGSEAVGTSDLVGRNIPGTGNMNIRRTGFDDLFGNESSVGLSMSQGMEDQSSCLNYAGNKKVRVNQVMDSNNEMSTSVGVGRLYGGDNSAISMGPMYNKSNNNISLGSTYIYGEDSTVSAGFNYAKTDDNLIPVGPTFNKEENGHFMWMGNNYKLDNGMLSMCQPFDKADGNFISMGHLYEKGGGNVVSTDRHCSKGSDNFIPTSAAYNNARGNFISTGPDYEKSDNIISMAPNVSINKGDSSILSTSQNYSKGESNTISFEAFHNQSETDPSGNTNNGYDLLTSQPSGQASSAPVQEDSVERNADPIVSTAPATTSRTEKKPKNKEQKVAKKLPQNDFPSNVKSLLSTGLFDGVPVKYASWSREKNLAGIIKGTGFLCGCDKCKLSKAVNAYEFERHAGSNKTKHPNSHIFFENGKSVYTVVQELKSTPKDMLFDVILNVTGSPLNQKNFSVWKASYQAASRELQRIYGKDEEAMPSLSTR